MGWQFTVYAVPTLLATVTALLVAGYTVTTLRGRDTDPTVDIFLGITVAVAAWTGFSALKLLQTDPETKLLLYGLLHVGVATLPPLFFLFTLAYTDRDHWLRRDVVAAVCAVPAVFVVLLVGNPAGIVVAGTDLSTDGLVTLSVVDGPAFLLFVLYSTLLTGGALALIGYEALRIGRSYYLQAALVWVGASAPVLFGVLHTVDSFPVASEVNLVPVSGAITAAVFGLVVFRYRLFDLPPLAYTTAMKDSPDGMVVLDTEERIVHVNPSGRAILDSSDSGLGDSMTALVPGFDPTTGPGTVFEADIDGTQSYFRPLVEALVRGGRQAGWVVVLRDVTEQYRRQELLERQANQLDAFAATVSHDLRNPLSVAQGRLQLVQQAHDIDDLEKVAAAHDRMADIIDDLLALSRQGKRIDDPEPVSLARVAELTWTNVATESATLAVDAERTIEADETMLKHVFSNLFRNAVEHAGDGIEVRVGALPDGFFVEDSGPGIPEQDRESVLEAGFTTADHGTGYGLHIVSSILDAHDWTLTVTEGHDGGARFEITDVTFR